MITSSPYFSYMKVSTWYRATRLPVEVWVKRYGSTFVFVQKYTGKLVFFNSQLILDMDMSFDNFVLFLQESLDKNVDWTTTADCLWYMMGFGSVIDREEYIDRSFAGHFSLLDE